MAAEKKKKPKQGGKKGLRGRVPSKRTINLVLIDEDKINPLHAVLGILIILVLAGLFSKYLVADRLIAMNASAGKAAQLKAGTYDVTVDSSSSMFKVRNAKITVADGKITATFDLSKSYTWFYLGATEEIAKADAASFIKGEATEEGLWRYTAEIEALDESIVCSAYSKNKEQWYPELILFRADSLPAGALNV